MSEIDELLDNLALLAGAEDTTLDYAGLGVEIVEAKTAIAALFEVQATRIAELEAALRELADALSAELGYRYDPQMQGIHPAMRDDYKLDTEPVRKARKLLEARP
jgi:hypothetical protein